ncbi:MAG: FAD-binding oxidoreductase [Ignavibacteriaceae bacterium]
MIIKKERDEIQNFLSDASNYKGSCDAVCFPESTEEVIEIVKEANRNKTNITVAGNGTGLTGARVPDGGIVIATDRLNRILITDTANKIVASQPGVILSELKTEVRKHKLLYPPDPTETNCFLGGTIATNASGAATFKYGSTRDYVSALTIVLPEGELLKIKRGETKADDFQLILKTESGKIKNLELPEFRMPETKNAAGYFCKKNMDAVDLFIGSEGTLGIITEATLRLIDLPEKLISCVVFFEKETDALSFIEAARNLTFRSNDSSSMKEIDALALEYFDAHSLRFLSSDFSNIPETAAAAVWFEQDVSGKDEDIILEKWLNLISAHSGNEESAWFALDYNSERKIRAFRHAVSEKVNEFITKNNFRKLGTDVAVPDDKFRELYFFSKELVHKAGIKFVIYGHFGNSHMHLNMLPKTVEEFETGKKLYASICLKTIDLGGTVSAEHGIGKIKREFLIQMYGENVIRKMAALKKTLDPGLILNKGNIFPDRILDSLS